MEIKAVIKYICPKEPVEVKSICKIFDNDNIKNDESKIKSHILNHMELISLVLR